MSFNSRYPGGLVIIGDGIEEEVPELLDETPELTNDGWDVLKQKWLVIDRALFSPHDVASAYFPRGNQLSGLNMWITAASGRTHGRGTHVIETTACGILSARGYKISTSAAVATQSATNVITPPYPPGVLRPKAEIAENQVTCDVSYISLGAAPRTVLTGRNVTPPNAPAVPASWWTWLSDPTYHDPNGWVLMASDGDGLPGVLHATVCLVVDRYQYIHPFSP
jgi:hypothetical protein